MVPVTVLLAKMIFHKKIQDGGVRHIENDTFGHKLAIFAYNFTEFDTEAVNGVPRVDLLSKFTQCKNQKS